MGKEKLTPPCNRGLAPETVIVKNNNKGNVRDISGFTTLDGLPFYIYAQNTSDKPTANSGRLIHKPSAPLHGNLFTDTPMYGELHLLEMSDEEHTDVTNNRFTYILQKLGQDTAQMSEQEIQECLNTLSQSQELYDTYSAFYEKFNDKDFHERVMEPVRESIQNIHKQHSNP